MLHTRARQEVKKRYLSSHLMHVGIQVLKDLPSSVADSCVLCLGGAKRGSCKVE